MPELALQELKNQEKNASNRMLQIKFIGLACIYISAVSSRANENAKQRIASKSHYVPLNIRGDLTIKILDTASRLILQVLHELL